MSDLKNPKIIVFKGFLFLFLGLFSITWIFIKVPRIDIAILVMISTWAFCRFYYFLFYVIENYVDSNFKYAGVFSALVYLAKQSNRESRN